MGRLLLLCCVLGLVIVLKSNIEILSNVFNSAISNIIIFIVIIVIIRDVVYDIGCGTTL